ncbi:MAG TPA: HAMP domain-containing protein, partial [Deltaproteobacteria bacterium]|nr:HAMP domain-containing protein [Deltaproteobacteria bacterium]
FSLRLSVRRRDEIGTLAREFDRMLEKIEVMNRIMEHINDQLIEDINKRQQIEDKLNEANK